MRTLAIIAALAALGTLGGAWFIHAGLYNPAATVQHTAPVYWLLNVAMRRSVIRQARDITSPTSTIERHSRADGCVSRPLRACHGALVWHPSFALGLTPRPPPRADCTRMGNPARLLGRAHGIKIPACRQGFV